MAISDTPSKIDISRLVKLFFACKYLTIRQILEFLIFLLKNVYKNLLINVSLHYLCQTLKRSLRVAICIKSTIKTKTMESTTKKQPRITFSTLPNLFYFLSYNERIRLYNNYATEYDTNDRSLWNRVIAKQPSRLLEPFLAKNGILWNGITLEWELDQEIRSEILQELTKKK